MVAHDIDHRLAALAGIVQEGDGIGETGPQVQERRCRLAGHAGIAIGRTGRDTFEQTQHAAHFRFAVQRRDEMHFGRAGIAETDFDAAVCQRMD